MLHVEDVIVPLSNMLIATSAPSASFSIRGRDEGDWNTRFLMSISMTTSMGKPLSTAQATTLLRLISTHRRVLAERYGEDRISELLERPIYRVEPYQTRNFPREVRHLGGNLLGFRFKLDPRVVDFLRLRLTNAMTASAVRPRFDHESRLWIVPVTRQSLPLIMAMLVEFDFSYDDTTLGWLTSAHNAEHANSLFFCHPETEHIVANVCDNEMVAVFVSEVLGGETA